MEKIWLDTDIGNDIDDTVTLAYLLRKPECRLLGISTVSGQTAERAKLADALCRVAGRHIPIFPGRDEPLLTPQRQSVPSQLKYLRDYPHGEDFPPGRAVEAMYQAIRENPGEVTLLAVGPMTNAALLLGVHPDVPALLKEIVVMCGEFFGRSSYRRVENEWNAYCDPYAAAILYHARGVRVRSIGLDVTSLVVMNAREVRERFTSPILKAVYHFGGFDAGERDGITFHDPLAAAGIFRPDIMTCLDGVVSVELNAGRVIGRTYFDPEDGGPHRVASAVDGEAFFNEYFSVFKEEIV